jgi:hypothetical protein
MYVCVNVWTSASMSTGWARRAEAGRGVRRGRATGGGERWTGTGAWAVAPHARHSPCGRVLVHAASVEAGRLPAHQRLGAHARSGSGVHHRWARARTHMHTHVCMHACVNACARMGACASEGVCMDGGGGEREGEGRGGRGREQGDRAAASGGQAQALGRLHHTRVTHRPYVCVCMHRQWRPVAPLRTSAWALVPAAAPASTTGGRAHAHTCTHMYACMHACVHAGTPARAKGCAWTVGAGSGVAAGGGGRRREQGDRAAASGGQAQALGRLHHARVTHRPGVCM